MHFHLKSKTNPDQILQRLRKNVLLLIEIPQQEKSIKQQQLQKQQEEKKALLEKIIELNDELKKGLESKKSYFQSHLSQWRNQLHAISEKNSEFNALDKDLKNKIITFCSTYLKRLDLQNKILDNSSLKKEILTQIQIRQWEREIRTIISQLAQSE